MRTLVSKILLPVEGHGTVQGLNKCIHQLSATVCFASAIWGECFSHIVRGVMSGLSLYVRRMNSNGTWAGSERLHPVARAVGYVLCGHFHFGHWLAYSHLSS